MAPRRGSSGGSYSGSSSSVCPNFLQAYYGSNVMLINYIAYCIFMVLTLATLVYACCVLRRSNSLIRVVIAALAVQSFYWVLNFIATTIKECNGFHTGYDYYGVTVVYFIFYYIAKWMLLFIQVWGVTRILSQRLKSGTVLKFATIGIMGVMAALTAAYVGISCYARWLILTPSGYRTSFENDSMLYTASDFSVAYWVLYLVSVLVGSAFSIALLMQMRSKSIAIDAVMKRVIAFNLCMLLWNIFGLAPTIIYNQQKFIDEKADAALYYICLFFEIFSYLSAISLCKLNFWKEDISQQKELPYETPDYAVTGPSELPSGQGEQRTGRPNIYHMVEDHPMYVR